MTDEDWLNKSAAKELRRWTGSRSKFEKIHLIPGFKELAVLAAKAEVLEFKGECPKIEEFVKAKASKLRLDAAKDKKRKRKDTGTAADTGKVAGADEEGKVVVKKAKNAVQATAS